MQQRLETNEGLRENLRTGRKYQSPFLLAPHFWQTFSRIINYLFALSIFLDQIFRETVIESGRWVCLITPGLQDE